MLGAAALAGALALLLVGRDLILKPEGADQPGAIRLLQLFTYNYRRSWPESLDFSGILTAFTVVGALATLALASWKWRRHAVYVFGAFAAAWAHLGNRRLHGADRPALGAARGGRGLLRGPCGAGGAARRLPDELEGGELLHGQPRAGVRLDRGDVYGVAQDPAREGGEDDVLHHRELAHRGAEGRSAGEERTRRSPTRCSTTSSSSSARSSEARSAAIRRRRNIRTPRRHPTE